jgi:Spy/CpxP family protein refolding chaperone
MIRMTYAVALAGLLAISTPVATSAQMGPGGGRGGPGMMQQDVDPATRQKMDQIYQQMQSLHSQMQALRDQMRSSGNGGGQGSQRGGGMG